MRQVFILALLGVWMCSCNETAETTNDSLPSDMPRVDTVSVLPKDTVAKTADTIPAEPVYKSSFKIQFTRSYCGGARPTEQILDNYRTPIPLGASTLKFRNHFTGKEYFLHTGADGVASADMEEGKYDVFFTKDIDESLPTGFDPECNLWQNELLFTVKVTSSGKMQDVTVHFVCNPCDETIKRRP